MISIERTTIDNGWVDRLEGEIDKMQATLPPLTNFILPVCCHSPLLTHCLPIAYTSLPHFVSQPLLHHCQVQLNEWYCD
jgi:hypothetical protein